MRKWFLAGSIFLAAVLCAAEGNAANSGTADVEELFRRGNDHYEKGEYSTAAGEYEKIIAQGYESGPVYYDLAGAYFKSGKLGKAILNYERARFLMPRDADLDTNYRFARTTVRAKVIPRGGIWNWLPLRICSNNLTVDELTLLCSGIYVLVVILVFTALVHPVLRRFCSVHATVLFILVLLGSSLIWHEVSVMKQSAVTVVPKADAFFGPFDSATKFFVLNEGMNVTALKSKDDWLRIKRVDGKVGWVKKDEVERI